MILRYFLFIQLCLNVISCTPSASSGLFLVNGKEAEQRFAKQTVELKIQLTGEKRKRCSGGIISLEPVIIIQTAAHCTVDEAGKPMLPSQISVILPEAASPKLPPGVSAKQGKSIAHPVSIHINQNAMTTETAASLVVDGITNAAHTRAKGANGKGQIVGLTTAVNSKKKKINSFQSALCSQISQLIKTIYFFSFFCRT